MSDAVPRRSLPIGIMMSVPGAASKVMELWRRRGAAHPATSAPRVSEADRRLSVWNRLMGKAARGFGVPGEGSIAWGSLPDAVRKAADPQEPIIGWDPSQLDPEEHLLLLQLQQRAQQEQQAARGEEPQVLAAKN